MSWRHPTERDWDHRRDLAKHEPRPGERGFEPPSNDFPARFERALSTAEDIAICVRGMKNVADAAALIERYAALKVKEAASAQD